MIPRKIFSDLFVTELWKNLHSYIFTELCAYKPLLYGTYVEGNMLCNSMQKMPRFGYLEIQENATLFERFSTKFNRYQLILEFK